MCSLAQFKICTLSLSLSLSLSPSLCVVGGVYVLYEIAIHVNILTDYSLNASFRRARIFSLSLFLSFYFLQFFFCLGCRFGAHLASVLNANQSLRERERERRRMHFQSQITSFNFLSLPLFFSHIKNQVPSTSIQ